MIFASDLDQTLIYSRRRLRSLPEDERIVIEYKDGAPLSFMSRMSQSLLKEISARLLFVPITTRIMDQYKRINLGVFEDEAPYAVISNGGRVLINGSDDPDWEDHIRGGLEQQCAGLEMVLRYFNEGYRGGWVQSVRNAEGLFIYCIVDAENTPVEKLSRFGEWLAEHNWDLSVQGRKIYFIPKVLQKAKALEYISEKTGRQLFAGAGDSYLDLSFLKIVEHPFVPCHGELYSTYKSRLDGMVVTKEESYRASEELLTRILERLS